MNVAQKIDQLRDYDQRAPEEFRDQLERGRAAVAAFGTQGTPSVRGVDRSGELVPLARPLIIRTLAES